VTARVRLFAERDYSAFVRIKRLAEQRPLTVEEVRERDARWDHSRYERVRVVAVDEEDAPVGYGEIYHESSRFDPSRYFVRLAVDAPLRRRGIGAAIWDALRAELDERAARVACLWADDGTACREFVVRRGFVEVVRAYEQVLALANAPAGAAGAELALATRGIRIASLGELLRGDEERVWKEVYELYTAARVDQPTLGRVTARPFAEWRHEVFEELGAIVDAFFIAIAADRMVGCSALHPSGEDVARMLITGVLPAFRRRGIARALKLRAHAWARDRGYREIHTSTAAANVGMVALNTALGYAIVDSWGGYELAIR
jgi:GNAT superfamily N-acetyltransferase